MRYFEINEKQCRGLQFDKQLLGANKEKLVNHNVFIRNIPKEAKHADLHKKFSQVGEIKSLKISLNQDHTSRGYGFICFQNEESVNEAIKHSENDEDTVAIRFEAKDKNSIKKLGNNIYFKNIPIDMEDIQIR